jgi:hypothetical protein
MDEIIDMLFGSLRGLIGFKTDDPQAKWARIGCITATALVIAAAVVIAVIYYDDIL